MIDYKNIYESGDYLSKTNQSWHAEDSPWKADQILKMIQRASLHPKKIVEIGCGAGRILDELANRTYLNDAVFEGHDISPQAHEMSKKFENERCTFYCGDLLADFDADSRKFDLLLAIDVFEQIPNYIEFIESCNAVADYKIYHIPLDIHVSSVLRGSLVRGRYSIGHLHYFTAETALATIKGTGHEIVDYFYTDGALGLFKHHPTMMRTLANGPRWLLSRVSVPLAARLLGGYSLMVLAK